METARRFGNWFETAVGRGRSLRELAERRGKACAPKPERERRWPSGNHSLANERRFVDATETQPSNLTGLSHANNTAWRGIRLRRRLAWMELSPAPSR